MDVTQVPGLSSYILETIHSILGPMMYAPKVFTLNIEQQLSGTPINAAIGVIKVTVHSARGISTNTIGGGTPDPYVTFSINSGKQLAETKHKSS
jgi:Ca2+-dependent lipid-binding protein